MKRKPITTLILALLMTIALCPAMASADDELLSITDTEDFSECGASGGAVIWGPWETIQSPTCTQDGIQQKTSVNGEVYTATIPAFGHSMCDYPTYATCTSGGYIVHQCSTCGYSYTDSETGALGHDMGGWVTTRSATCTESGEQSRTCIRCGYTETQSIPSNGGHQMSDNVVSATCGSGGYTEHRCSICGYSYTDSETGALGHSYGSWTTTRSATCSANGEQVRSCTRCGVSETKTIPATGNHSFVNTVVSPTCTSGGYTEHKCSVCGYSYTDSQTAAKSHTFGSWTTTKSATCSTSGEKTRKCSKCGYTETQTIAATGKHSFRSWKTTTAATCATAGEKERACSSCGYVEKQTIAATGWHSFSSWETTKRATCVESGLKVRTCSTCGLREETVIDATGKHLCNTSVHDPTCLEEGYTLHTCVNCGYSYKDTEKPKSNHKWYDWKTTKRADCGHDGEETRTCSVCGATETRVLEKTGKHTIVDTVIAPTCKNGGYTEHKCSVCGYTTKDRETKQVDCSFGQWTTQKQATCVENGTSTRTCKWCGKVETRTDKATGVHSYKTTYVQPTCEEQGYDLHKCSMCGLEYRDNFEAPIGHAIAFENKTATCQHDGYGNKVCVWCGKIFEENVYIPNSGHATEKTVVQATRTSHGSETWACKYCGEIETQKILHYYVMTDAVPPSGNQDGYTVFTCTVCGDSYRDPYLKYDSFVVELANSGKTETEQVQDIANTISAADGTCLTYALRVANACNSCGIEYKIHHITDADAMAQFGYTDADIEYAKKTGFFPNGIGIDHYWVTCVADGKTYTFGL